MKNTNLLQEMRDKNLCVLEMFKSIFPDAIQEDCYALRMKLKDDMEVWVDFFTDVLQYNCYNAKTGERAEIWVGCRFSYFQPKHIIEYHDFAKLITENVITKFPFKPFKDEDAVNYYFRMKPYRKLESDGAATFTMFVNPEIPNGAWENHVL